MALKHVQALVWALCLASAIGALAQDSDGDGVLDDAPDHCPDTVGVDTNYGCPANLEVVIATGSWSDHFEPHLGWWRTWMVSYVLCPDGYFYPAETSCPDYDTWGHYAVAHYDSLGEHQVTEIKDITVYRGGVCPRNLGPFPFQIGIVRHDDVVSHVEKSNEVQPRRSGYFAANEPAAVLAAGIDLANYRATGSWRTLTLVPGVHKHSNDGDCGATLPEVSQAEFDRIRRDANGTAWYRYHLLRCNCQHWADRVVSRVDRRPPECIGHFVH